MNQLYLASGIELSKIEASRIPSIVGTVATIDTKTLSLATIGDHFNAYIDPANGINSIAPRQNVGIDFTTQRVVNSLIRLGVGKDVESVLRSDVFKRWIEFTFDNKLNVKGRVSAVNGMNFDRNEIARTQIPMTWISELILGTDGLAMGTYSFQEEVLEISRSVLLDSEGKVDFALLKYLKSKRKRQISAFTSITCTQDKTSDDIGAIHIKTGNTLDTLAWEANFLRTVK